MEHRSVERRVKIIFAKNILSKKALNFWNFSKQIRHCQLPTALFNFDDHFRQTYVQDPFAYWLAALAAS